VAGAVEAATLIALAISLTAGGPIVEWLGPRAAYYVGGALTVVAALIMAGPLRNPGLPPHQADKAFEFGPAERVAVDRSAKP
jgi:MFS family permease